jgi:hypothetical protein
MQRFECATLKTNLEASRRACFGIALTLSISIVLSMDACTGDLLQSLSDGRVQGDQTGATIKADSAADGFPLAIAHCSRFGRAARFDRKASNGVYRYACVASD